MNGDVFDVPEEFIFLNNYKGATYWHARSLLEMIKEGSLSDALVIDPEGELLETEKIRGFCFGLH